MDLRLRPEDEEDLPAESEDSDLEEGASGMIPAAVRDLMLGAHHPGELQTGHRMPWTLPGQAAAHAGHAGARGTGNVARPSRSDAVLKMVAQKYGAAAPDEMGPDAIREAQVKDYLARKWGEAGRQGNIAESIILNRNIPSAPIETDRNLQDLMARRGAAMQDAQARMAQEEMAQEKDPTSARSRMFRALATQVGYQGTGEESAADLRAALPALQRHFDAAAAISTRKDLAQAMAGMTERRQAETERHNREMEKRPVAGVGTLDDATDVAKAIRQGIQPPTLQGLGRGGALRVRALLQRGDPETGEGPYDFTTASREWQSVTKLMSSLNSPQQTRLRQSIDFASHSLDQIEDLYDRWQKVGPASGFKILNRVALAGAKNMPGEAGAVAQGLQAQINDLTEALGNIYMGGNTPTDAAFKLAQQNLQGDWNEQTFKKSVALVRNNLRMRQNAIANMGPMGVRPDSPYWPKSEAPAVTEPKPATQALSPAQLDHLKSQLKPGETLVLDDQGKPQALKPGAALPKGWTKP